MTTGPVSAIIFSMRRNKIRAYQKFIVVCALFFLAAGVCGCSWVRGFMRPKTDNSPADVSLPSYSGAKAQVAVADFEVKAAKATGEAGVGLREMMVVALNSSQRFTVLKKEDLNAAKTADLIISATVTEFEPQASGGRAGVGGGGGVGSGVFGGLLGAAFSKAHMALEVRIMDSSNSKILATTRVQGQASEAASSPKTGPGNLALSKDLGAYANTPMEKAIRICIIEAVRYISQAVPESYYKY